jgi:hypothetical protein
MYLIEKKPVTNACRFFGLVKWVSLRNFYYFCFSDFKVNIPQIQPQL